MTIISGVDSVTGSLYYSTVTISTLGHGDIIPITALGRFITSTETIIGYFMVIVIFARFVTLLIHPWTKSRVEQEAHRKVTKKEEIYHKNRQMYR